MSSELSHLINGISAYDTNIMLAALISLLLVILFVLLLHIYTKWFLSQARQRRLQSSSVTVSHVLHPSRFHMLHTHHLDDTTATNSPSKGLDASVIASIPLFVYKSNDVKLEYCVICLSAFEEEEIGRELPKCGHGFHVQCIDMWLHSHTNCPICRASVVVNDETEESNTETVLVDVSSIDSVTIENVMENNDDSSSSSSSSTTSSMSSLGNSLKRMLSRNSSEHKVCPTSNQSELEA
ncbi:RING-H2 finger protein ATL63-like [Tripterygium wilfordii]|uniref:RING-type E3 ubiquitin transferase n=1 Tax=Tripterygium wilfordii TaxID=458696 RepID=A0A7J7DY87_TRIWF|nr:RING-H2 finger protein ATL63-like [Tripterygium wilfordii]KAF5751350.1 RING-H2 finger protein ATL63-like [Tripterygium wilfordii]